MPTSSSSFLVALLLLVSSAPHPLSSSILAPSRRILHRPFFPQQDSFPPSQPPSPSPPSPSTPPKLPFSTSTPTNSPFFPSFPSPPPPPPSPASFASFPANISSLILPQSPRPKPTSHKFLALTIAAVVSAIVVLGLTILYYTRRKQSRSLTDDKSCRSDNINGSSNNALYPANAAAATTNRHKIRTTSTSSEFLYLGTLVNSRSVNGISDSSFDNVEADPRKLESPELLPLPPLNRQSSLRHGEVASTTGDDDDEEFYSPIGSLGGCESSSGTGSGSRRVLETVASGNYDGHFDVRTTDDSSCYSSSTSASASPARSQSLSISPPLRQSPHRKSPESSNIVQTPSPPPSPPPPLLPAIILETSSSPSPSACSSPRLSPKILLNLEQRVQSDSLSSASNKSSPRVLNDLGQNVRSPSLSPARIVNDLGQNRVTTAISSVSTSLAASPARVSDHLDQNVWSALFASVSSSSPDRVSEKNPSQKISIDLDGNRNGNVRSPSLSSVSFSPDTGVENNPFDGNKTSPLLSSASSTPDRVLALVKGLDESPRMVSGVLSLNEKISNVLEQSISPPQPPPPPPPPPPAPLVAQRSWESPSTSTPTGQPIVKPPMLIPPSKPFVIQNTTKVSPIELPSRSATLENTEETSKPKLKPLHWDKVRASSDREMVWDHLRSSSFK